MAKPLIAIIVVMIVSQMVMAQPSPPPPPTAPSGVPIDGGILALLGGLGAYLARKYFKKK